MRRSRQPELKCKSRARRYERVTSTQIYGKATHQYKLKGTEWRTNANVQHIAYVHVFLKVINVLQKMLGNAGKRNANFISSVSQRLRRESPSPFFKKMVKIILQVGLITLFRSIQWSSKKCVWQGMLISQLSVFFSTFSQLRVKIITRQQAA